MKYYFSCSTFLTSFFFSLVNNMIDYSADNKRSEDHPDQHRINFDIRDKSAAQRRDGIYCNRFHFMSISSGLSISSDTYLPFFFR